MKHVLIDFRDCSKKEQMHEKIRTALGLPEWYGANLDALWDSLLGITKLPLSATLVCEAENGDPYIDRIIDTFEDAAEENNKIRVEVIRSKKICRS